MISTALTETVLAEVLGFVLVVYFFMGFTAGAIAPLVFDAVLDYVASSAFGMASANVPEWIWAFATLALGSLVALATAVTLHRNRSRHAFYHDRLR